MINKKQGASALVIMAFGLWASSSSHQALTNSPTHSSYVLAESAENGLQGIVEQWDFANPAVTQVVAPAAPVVVARSQYSFVTIGSKGLPARWDPCTSLTWRIDWSNAPKDFPKKHFKRAAINAMRQIRKATGLQIRMSESESVPSILVKFARTNDMPGEDVLGYALVNVSDDRTEILHADIVLDATAANNHRIGWYGWKNVILHEMGHAVGLNHAEDESQVMFEFSNGTENFLSGDLTALRIVGAANGCLIR
jgi:hypothetical protein